MSDIPVPRRPEFPDSPFVELADRARDFAANPRVRAVVLLAVSAVAGLVWFGLGSSGGEPTGVTSPSTANTASRSTTTTTEAKKELLVHVAGAVLRPGLVRLSTGDRVADAIAAAGGGLPDADLDRLNLAAVLSDGERVAVARVGQPAPIAPGSGSAGAASGTSGSRTSDGPININTATQAELETLPGIGPSLGAAIIATRERLGGFDQIEQLREVRGIGDLRFADLRELVVV